LCVAFFCRKRNSFRSKIDGNFDSLINFENSIDGMNEHFRITVDPIIKSVCVLFCFFFLLTTLYWLSSPTTPYILPFSSDSDNTMFFGCESPITHPLHTHYTPITHPLHTHYTPIQLFIPYTHYISIHMTYTKDREITQISVNR
jgi:hypothetical protein